METKDIKWPGGVNETEFRAALDEAVGLERHRWINFCNDAIDHMAQAVYERDGDATQSMVGEATAYQAVAGAIEQAIRLSDNQTMAWFREAHPGVAEMVEGGQMSVREAFDAALAMMNKKSLS